MEEAALLNLKSISPIDFSKGYSDWQEVGFKERTAKLMFWALLPIARLLTDTLMFCGKPDFAPVAVEFSALAIARMIKESGTGIDLEKAAGGCQYRERRN